LLILPRLTITKAAALEGSIKRVAEEKVFKMKNVGKRKEKKKTYKKRSQTKVCVIFKIFLLSLSLSLPLPYYT